MSANNFALMVFLFFGFAMVVLGIVGWKKDGYHILVSLLVFGGAAMVFVALGVLLLRPSAGPVPQDTARTLPEVEILTPPGQGLPPSKRHERKVGILYSHTPT